MTKLLKFKQDNCTPCKMAEQYITQELKTEADETINISDGDDRAMSLVEKYDVMQTPTFVLVDENGEKIESVTGTGHNKLKTIFQKRGLI